MVTLKGTGRQFQPGSTMRIQWNSALHRRFAGSGAKKEKESASRARPEGARLVAHEDSSAAEARCEDAKFG